MASIPVMRDQIAIDPVPGTQDRFTSRLFPQRMGNAAPIAYGGCTASLAVHAACKTVKPTFHIYSLLGAFHGPTRIDRRVNCRVERTRDTKTFVTRRVVASQTLDDGTERTCADVLVDFHVLEMALLTYSAPPHDLSYLERGPTDPSSTATFPEIAQDLVNQGLIPQSTADASRTMFAMAETIYESRQCTTGVSAQNFMGQLKTVRTSQDERALWDKTSAEWMRLREPLDSAAENAAALSFIMDGALSFMPLNHSRLNFADAGACSTLDFALRVLVPGDKLRLEEWHLRERRTVAGAVGRTFSEGRIWDERGTLVAVESQSCILRPLPEAKAKM